MSDLKSENLPASTEPGLSKNALEVFAPNSLETSIPKTLIDRLLDEADEKFEGDGLESNINYFGFEGNEHAFDEGQQWLNVAKYGRKLDRARIKTFSVDERYAPLVFGDDPAKYKMVSYSSHEEADGSRRRTVTLATQSKISSDGFRSEITFAKTNDTYGIEYKVYLNEGRRPPDSKSNTENNNVGEKSHGSLEIKYELLPDGTQKRTGFLAARHDEATVDVGGEHKVVAFDRRIHMADDLYNLNYPIYEESYTPKGGELLGVLGFFVKGDVTNPSLIQAFVGRYIRQWDMPSKTIAKALFGGAEILLQKGREDWLEYLSQDPNFDFLKKRRANKKEMIGFLNDRIQMLKDSMLSEQNVFDGGLEIDKPE